MTAKISIALALHHDDVRDDVRRLLESEPDYVIVGESSVGLEVVPLVRRLRPQVLVVDLLLPGLGGLEITAEVARRAPGTKVVILSVSHEAVFVLEALRNGAAGFVTLDTSGTELARAVREIMAGRHFLSPALSEVVIEAYLGGTASPDAYATLTRREREVLHLVARGLSAKEIARRLEMSPRTAETHRSHVMHKLGLRSRNELIRFAHRRGIVSGDLGQQSA